MPSRCRPICTNGCDSLAEQLSLAGVKRGQVGDDFDLEGLVALLSVVLDRRAAYRGLEVLTQGLGQAMVGGQGVAGCQGDLHQLAGGELSRAHADAHLGAGGVTTNVLTCARALGPHGTGRAGRTGGVGGCGGA